MDLFHEAARLLSDGTRDSYREVHLIMEDAESPVTKKTIESLYNSVINKSHIDFDTIPNSKGDITAYTGYKSMVQTLADLMTMSTEDSAYKDLGIYVKSVQHAIANIQGFSKFYMQAFQKKMERLVIEYNIFVYTCVEATTSLLYQFSDYIKTPSSHEMRVRLQNTKYRADMFYIQQLQSFNRLCASGDYKKYLSGIIVSGTDNFLGFDDAALITGSLAIISAVALSIVPITRRLIYSFQNARGKLAEDLELQAYFLELNKNSIESSKSKTPAEKKKILEKQEKTRLKFLRLAEKLRVKSMRAEEYAKQTLAKDDKTMTISNMKDKASNGDSDDDDFIIM